jgi:DNA-binding NarL/FixJ family response regulator
MPLMGASVLIVDDHSGFRAQARRLLECEGYRVIGEAGDVASALEAARALEPELALVDVYLPDGDGFELTTRLVALDAAPAVVLTSSHDGADLAGCVEGSGARGFVPKAELSREAIEELLG